MVCCAEFNYNVQFHLAKLHSESTEFCIKVVTSLGISELQSLETFKIKHLGVSFSIHTINRNRDSVSLMTQIKSQGVYPL